AKPLVRKLIEDEVQKQIASVVPHELDSAISGALGKPITHSVLGTNVSLAVTPTSVGFDAQGESFAFDANVTVDPIAGAPAHPAPGSLVTQGTPPTLGAGPGLLVSVNQDLLDRAGFAAWQSGLMDLRLDAQSAGKFGMSPTTLPLDAAFVQNYVPELRG